MEIDKCCDILGISRNASYNEAKTAYRELATLYHPDKHMHNERLAARAAEKFKELLNAWNDFEVHYQQFEQIRREQESEDLLRKQREREREEAQRAEEARRAEEALRAKAARRAEEVRKADEERKYVIYACEHCGIENKVLRTISFESAKCGNCKQFLSIEREAKEQLKEKERTNSSNINKDKEHSEYYQPPYNTQANNTSHKGDNSNSGIETIKFAYKTVCIIGVCLGLLIALKPDILERIFTFMGIFVVLLPVFIFIFIMSGGFNHFVDSFEKNNRTR